MTQSLSLPFYGVGCCSLTLLPAVIWGQHVCVLCPSSLMDLRSWSGGGTTHCGSVQGVLLRTQQNLGATVGPLNCCLKLRMGGVPPVLRLGEAVWWRVGIPERPWHNPPLIGLQSPLCTRPSLAREKGHMSSSGQGVPPQRPGRASTSSFAPGCPLLPRESPCWLQCLQGQLRCLWKIGYRMGGRPVGK